MLPYLKQRVTKGLTFFMLLLQSCGGPHLGGLCQSGLSFKNVASVGDLIKRASPCQCYTLLLLLDLQPVNKEFDTS